MLASLREAKLEVLKANVAERVAFRREIGEGSSVEELGKDTSAIAEMAAFYKEVTGR